MPSSCLHLMKKILLGILILALLFPVTWDMGEVMAASKSARKLIATEGQRFTVSGSKTVRFGTPTRWVEKQVKGSGVCSVRFFWSGSGPVSVQVLHGEEVEQEEV